MQKVITFIPPDIGRACNGCNECCIWLSAEAYGFKFGSGLPCTFLFDNKCSIYEHRPNGCKAFQCYWKTDFSVPEWLKPNESNVILGKETFAGYTYISVVFTGKPIKAVFDYIEEQTELGKNFVIWHNKKVYSKDKNFEKMMKSISRTYGV